MWSCLMVVLAAQLSGWTWEPRTHWLANPAANPVARLDADCWVFEITEPGRGMKWEAGPESALAIEPGSFLVIEYRATDVHPGDDYAFWIHTGPKGLNVLPLRQLETDARWHTLAVDLDGMGLEGAIQSLAVQVQAGQRVPARLEVRRVAQIFEAPAGARILPAPLPEAPPWRWDCDSADGWQARPDWLANASPRAVLQVRDGVLRLEAPEAATGMKWSCRLADPVDLDKLRYATVRYRAQGLADHPDYLIYLGSEAGGMPPESEMPLRLRDLTDDGHWHVAVCPVRGRFQAVEMALQVQADQPDAFIELDFVSFTSRRPRINLSDVFTWRDGWPDPTGALQALPLPTGDARFADLAPGLQGWFTSDRVTVEGLPFALAAPDALLATPVLGGGEVTVPVDGRAHEAYLLLAARLPTTDVHWIGANPVPLQFVRIPERFVLQWVYADGEVDEVFPARLPALRYGVWSGLGAYTVPVPRHEPLRELRLRDNLRHGAFALVALTVNRGERRFPLEAGLEVYPSAVISPDRLARPAPPPVAIPTMPFSVLEGDELLPVDGEPRLETDGPSRTATFRLARDLQAVYRATTTDEGVEMRLSIQNLGTEPRALRVVFPSLAGLHVGEAATDDWLFLPRRAAQFTPASGRFTASYAGNDLALQFVALFDGAGCVYLCGRDLSGDRRAYIVTKTPGGTDLSVESEVTPLAPGGELALPAHLLAAAPGDWHVAFEAHRRWLAQALPAPLAPRKDWFRRIFCFRQHFLHQGALFDPASGRWNVDPVVRDDRQAFGFAEYFHFFDWGASDTYGRVGDYSHYDEIGGLEAFRAAVSRLQQLGVRVGLYFEGYLVDSRSLAGQKHLPEWSMPDRDGKPQMWADSDTEHVVCPWSPGWRDYLRDTVARVEREVGADGYYLDEFGFGSRTCWSADHGHPVPWSVTAGEMGLERAVRSALPPDRALYVEEEHVDAAATLHDGAFTYVVADWANSRAPAVPLAPLRFARPDMKTFEILAFHAYQWPHIWSLAKYAFLNGEAIWLQGAPSSFADQALDLLRRIFRLQHEHADAFLSDHVTPLIPTLRPGVYANEFLADRERVLTVYNALHHTVRGEVLSLPHRPGARYEDAWNGRDLTPRIADGLAHVALTLGPEQVGCVVQRW